MGGTGGYIVLRMKYFKLILRMMWAEGTAPPYRPPREYDVEIYTKKKKQSKYAMRKYYYYVRLFTMSCTNIIV